MTRDKDSTASIDPASLPYRRCVGIMLINAGGLVWIGRRRETIPGHAESWQMPQGGIDPNEDAYSAAVRELGEETGTEKIEPLGETRLWLHYDLPPELIGLALQGKYRGQTQKWFAMRFTGADDDFNIHDPLYDAKPEFDAWRWAEANELLDLIVPFKRSVYEAVVAEFRPFLK